MAAIQQAQTQKAISEYQSKQLLNDAEHTDEQAGEIRQEGIEQARTRKLKSILEMGKEKTDAASGNIATTSDTLLKINENTKLAGELDALNTLRDSEFRAENKIYQADKLYSNLALNRYKTSSDYLNSTMRITANVVDKSFAVGNAINENKGE